MTQFDNDYQNQYQEECDFDENDEQKISEFYTQRRLQKNQMERKVRQSQMWLKRLRVLLRMATIIFLMFCTYKLVKLHQWYLPSDVFNSSNSPSLEILNNNIVPSYKILAALRRTELPNKPIYRLETGEIKNNIMKLEPIENVYVRRFWFPARLQIIVEERAPIITISPDVKIAPIAYLAKNGKLIGRDYMPLPKQFKTILVLTYGTKGDDYRNWDGEKIKLLENIAKTVNEFSNERVEYIDLRNSRDVYVKIKSANVRLGVLDDTVFERIARIASILPQIKTLDKPIKYVDLRWKNANYIKLG